MQTHEDYAQCVELQKETWGQTFNDVVTEAVIKISQKVGGVAAGAFTPAGRMLGFVWGLTGIRDKRLAHWSHMLAVRPETQGLGLGRRLKQYQREILLDLGVEVMYWTFDPLVARNANLNLNSLGAGVAEYVENMYGEHSGSDLHSGLGTDRFIAQWELRHSTPQGREGTPDLAALPSVMGDAPPPPLPESMALPAAVAVRVEIPADIQAVKARAMDEGWRWRLCTRRAFQWYLARGYRVQRFYQDAATQRYFYVVARQA